MQQWTSLPCQSLDEKAQAGAVSRQASLTKPPSALGELEGLAIRLAGMQCTALPMVSQPQITIFAADHGVAAEGVSAFPQSVTLEMVKNFGTGGAAISVLAKSLGAHLEVINLGTIEPQAAAIDGVTEARIAAGTANFVTGPAMTEKQLETALDEGRQCIDRIVERGLELFIGGEMGIANTTSAAALGCALTQLPAATMAGPGTGLSLQGVQSKAEIIRRGLKYHGTDHPPIELLRRLGGFEIAALTGAYIRCAQKGIPALVDGFISTAAALVAVKHQPDVLDWLIFSHTSAEPGHSRILEALEARPLISLGLKLGEGSGAAVTFPLIQMACQLHSQMATFSEAGVSEKID